MIILRQNSYSNHKVIDEINTRFLDDKEDLTNSDIEDLTKIKESSNDPEVIDAVIRKLNGTLPNPKNTKRNQIIATGLGNKN